MIKQLPVMTDIEICNCPVCDSEKISIHYNVANQCKPHIRITCTKCGFETALDNWNKLGERVKVK